MTVGAPSSYDEEMFEEFPFLKSTTNCYSYAVQCYGSGYITDEQKSYIRLPSNMIDFNYMARPGQTKGNSYTELFSVQPSKSPSWRKWRKQVMIQALKQDKVLYQGENYPSNIPSNMYVICCFLEPNSYHFLRQNRDGRWTSKNGGQSVSDKRADDITPIAKNPKAFYNYDKDYEFVGYFLVPSDGIEIGLKKHLQEVKITNTDAFNLLQSYQRKSSPDGKGIVLGERNLIVEKRKALKDLLNSANKVYKKTSLQIKEIRDIFRDIEKFKKFKQSYGDKVLKAKKSAEIIAFEIKENMKSIDVRKELEIRFILNSDYKKSKNLINKVIGMSKTLSR